MHMHTPSHVAHNQSTVNPASDQTEQQVFYDTVDDSIQVSTSENEAYGKFEETTFTNDVLHSNVSDLPSSQNDDIPTSTITNDEPDYYVNEGLNDPRSSMIENKTYDDIEGQSSSSRVTGSLDDTSIPTTRNEAYSSVSTNTERVDTEETYDYVRNL